jgi:hypothetical protein
MCKNHSQKLATRQISIQSFSCDFKFNPVFENKYYFTHLTLSMSRFQLHGFFTLCNIGKVVCVMLL